MPTVGRRRVVSESACDAVVHICDTSARIRWSAAAFVVVTICTRGIANVTSPMGNAVCWSVMLSARGRRGRRKQPNLMMVTPTFSKSMLITWQPVMLLS